MTNNRRRPCCRRAVSAAGMPGITSLPRQRTPSQSSMRVRTPRSASGASLELKIAAGCGRMEGFVDARDLGSRRLHCLHGRASCVSTSRAGTLVLPADGEGLKLWHCIVLQVDI